MHHIIYQISKYNITKSHDQSYKALILFTINILEQLCRYVESIKQASMEILKI
jgi:hypothetical protein